MPGSRRAARAAFVLGALAILAVPGGVLAARYLSGVTLLRALYVAVPVGCLLGLLAVVAARRARVTAARSVRPDARGAGRAARSVAWTGLYLGFTAALALAVYGALRWAQ
jgi:hypothetical protein